MNNYYTRNVDDDFFLTQHSAQLMEDLVRDLESGAPLFLLYGEPGVGKTRLLRELREIGLAGREVHWLNLGEEDDSRRDRSEEVEELFENAAGRDIVIVDHFESGLQRTRHQLFVSWSTLGRQKQIGMIVASSDRLLDEFCQLAEQYQVEMNSTRQLPFNKAEVTEFLASYLFPDHLSGEITMPTALARQLAGIRGNPGALIEFAERQGKHVGIATPTIGSSWNGNRLVMAIFGVLLLVGGIAWYLTAEIPRGEVTTIAGKELMGPAPQPVTAGPVTDAPAGRPAAVPEAANSMAGPQMAAADPAAGPQSVPATETDVEAVPQIASVAAMTALPVEAKPAASAAPVGEPVSTTADGQVAGAAEVAAREDERDSTESENISEVVPNREFPEPAPSPPPVSWEELYPEELAVAKEPASKPSRFEGDLERSMSWINSRSDRVGTIQILLLSQDKFDAENFYGYVAELSAQQVDPEELRVFKTLTGNTEVYSVVYGEYESRSAALRAIEDLPPVLRDSGPLARSVGGLWEEIRRLESKN